ncbi:MAG TPA: putative baseplate assembly protein [Solirubrobacteraceae bacterium]|nr:putative baseplate assembly protein [Solirubrobacteraceae bacterium]
MAIEHEIVAVELTSGGIAGHCTPGGERAQTSGLGVADVFGEMVLDDLRFQELVGEARTRIARHSPEWTEHNVSDPGITLIELFAWFTDVLAYRIDRIPERLHLALLDLIGITPAPPRLARTRIRLMLERPAAGMTIPAGTEVAAPRTAGQDAIVFGTTESVTFPADELSVHALDPPAPDQPLLVGFDRALSGFVIRIEVDGPPADGLAPPPVWEASGPAGTWSEAAVVDDETDGLLLGSGAITLDIPEQAAPAVLDGHELHWIRCRGVGRSGLVAARAFVVGVTVPAAHSGAVIDESLGVSEGVPGVAYALRHRPVLALEPGETLEVREPGSDTWTHWQPVSTFASSGNQDRHFMLDRIRGEIRFGPAIRQPEGGWRRFGAVPPAGSALRFSRYRYGGSAAGNVAAGALSLLASPIAGVASVTNPQAAGGGSDAESPDSARRRAALELRTRSRAVTAEDLERLTLGASTRVARALCVAPRGDGPVRVNVLPRVEPADRLLAIEELMPDQGLMERLAEKLEERRLIGTSVLLTPARIRGVSVAVEVRVTPLADLERVRQDVEHALYTYLNPLIGGSPDGPGAGWPVGRAVNQGELFGIVYGISGVESVVVLRMYETDLRTGEQAAQPTDSRMQIEPDELVASGRHFVRAVAGS